jgi:hypothetical protein
MIVGKSRHYGLALLSLFCLLLAPHIGVTEVSAQNLPVSTLTLSQVVQRMVQRNAERTQALGKYRGKRTYVMDYRGIPTDLHAEMVVDMEYDAPGTKTFTVESESGSKLLQNLIFKRLLESEEESMNSANRDSVLISPQNYDFSSLQYMSAEDGCSYVITVQPKTQNKFLFRGRIFVDEKDFAVCRIEAEPAKNPSFWIKKTDIHHRYTKIGDFWLPQENVSVTTMRFSGKATLTIKYQSYEILQAQSVKSEDSGIGSASTRMLDH